MIRLIDRSSHNLGNGGSSKYIERQTDRQTERQKMRNIRDTKKNKHTEKKRNV